MKGKKGKLGKAFHDYLEYLESVEAIMDAPDHLKPKMKMPDVSINEVNFPSGDNYDWTKAAMDMIVVDAELASVVRSGVKYKMDAATLVEMANRYEVELDYIANTVPQRLPFEWCVLVVEGLGDSDFVITASETFTKTGEAYTDIGYDDPAEKWICLNYVGYIHKGVKDLNDVRQNVRLSHIPAETHMRLGELEIDNQALHTTVDGIDMTESGRKLLGMLYRCFCLWLCQFELQSVLRSKSPGTPAMPGKHRKLHRKRKKHEHPQFEHTVIKLEVDAPEPGQTGLSMLQSKKRLHAVRGHWRTRNGERHFVKGHWRGDKELGVIRRDMELTLTGETDG
jgi:hypothetical protein